MEIDITKLMLHRPPMLLVDKVLEVVNGKFARTLFEIKSDNIFLDKNNVLKRSAQIEIMAQALAAANAYDSKINNNQENHDEDIERWENDGGMHVRTDKSRS